MSFKEVRDALVWAFADDVIDEDEFLVLYEEYRPCNPSFPYWDYRPFSLDDMDSSECKADFRLEKEDIPVLGNLLRVPRWFRCPQGTVCSGTEGLCLLLRRLAYPCRYSDLIPRFARSVPELCMISNVVLNWIYDEHGHRLTSWNQPFLSPDSLAVYARAVADKGGPLRNCFGFIDGTVRHICRPNENQRIVYNGHKRVHALKFQSVVVPNGLIANLYGPVEGRRHDAGLLNDSGLLNTLQQVAFSPAGDVLCLYGDPAYPLRPQILGPFREVVLTADMQAFNKAMSEVRISVEWLFGDIANYFKFVDYKKNLKIGMSAVGKQYIICAFMRNILTCLYGNGTSDFFQLDPPTIQEYLS